MLQPADLLLLDEPTNDLDIPTLEILEEPVEYLGRWCWSHTIRFMWTAYQPWLWGSMAREARSALPITRVGSLQRYASKVAPKAGDGNRGSKQLQSRGSLPPQKGNSPIQSPASSIT